MTREEFAKLAGTRVILLDGATGSNLMKLGMPSGSCTEKWVLEHPEAIRQIKEGYINAGTQIQYTPTFLANGIAMKDQKIDDDPAELNRKLVELEKDIAKGRVFLAGDMTMTGKAMIPNGTLSFDTAFENYKEQAQALYDAGVDLFVVETMAELQEMRAAYLAVRSVCDLPFIASFTVNADGYTYIGTEIISACLTMERMGADAVGLNCSTGPKEMLPIVKKLKKTVNVPVIVKANAGMPTHIDGKAVYPMSADEFAKHCEAIVDAGADLIGGCCGTDNEVIKKLKCILEERGLYVPLDKEGTVRERTAVTEYDHYLSGKRRMTAITDFCDMNRDGVLAEWPQLADAVLNAEYDEIAEALEDVEEDELLVVSMDGIQGLDDQMIENYICRTAAMNLCICFEESEPSLLEKDLRYYPGIAAVQLSSMKDKEAGKSLAEKYGAVIL